MRSSTLGLIGWVVCFSLMLSPPLRAEDGFYVGLVGIAAFSEIDDTENKGSLGGNTVNDGESDLVGGLGGVLGYQFAVPGGSIRAESDVHYRFRFDYDEARPIIDNALPFAGLDSNLASLTALANVNYAIDIGSDFTPYLGGGLGATYYSAENEFHDLVPGGLGQASDDTTGVNFTWTAGAGVIWDASERFYLLLGYRYIDLGDIDFGTFAAGGINVEGHYTSHDVMISAGYRF